MIRISKMKIYYTRMQLLAAIVMVAAVLGTILNDCYWIGTKNI